ncbi:hypothetical protein J4447_04535 [Candidatus Pacearchaeota archaeon]|nr:hypothetical protein [Candidatus Pacearchaeota archaeon]
MAKKPKFIGIRRTTAFNGRRKIGIDTNIFVRIYDQPFLLRVEASRIFNRHDIIFTHAACLREFTKHIMLKKNCDFHSAKEEAKDFIKSRNVRIIYPTECFIPEEELKTFEKQSNEKLANMGKEYLHCHEPDSVIILVFKKCGVNKIYSTDEAARICASFLGMDSSNLPSFDNKIMRELRKDKKFYKQRR